MVSGGEITVTSFAGDTEHPYRLGTVDTSTYTEEGLSWTSDDEGHLTGDDTSTGAGRTLVFFIDGVQVPQPVAVAKISGITRVDDDTVDVMYAVDSSDSDSGHGTSVRFTADDGELNVGDTGDMDDALLWNTDIPFTGTDQPESSAADIAHHLTDAPIVGTVSDGDYVSMTAADDTEIRCVITDETYCSAQDDYWTIEGNSANTVFPFDGQAIQSDLGQGWQLPATPLAVQEQVELEDSDTTLGWNGVHLVFFTPKDTIVVTPTEISTTTSP